MTSSSLNQDFDIGVVGLGNWGTALAEHCASSGYSVTAWSRNQSVVDSVNTKNINSKYLSEVKLSPNLKASSDLQEVCRKRIVILAVPAKVLAETLSGISFEDTTYCVSAIKGVDLKTGQTPLGLVADNFSSNLRLAVISGPGFAKDIVRNKPAGLVVASKSQEDSDVLARVFSSNTLRVYTSTDTFGVEMGGIVKNIIAIAAGVVDGLNLGDSARAGIITRGLAEMTELAVTAGAKKETLFGLSGLGDLILTATCDASRNRRVGLGLGEGKSLESVIKSLGSVAEGINSTPIILNYAKEHNIEMPISEHVQLVLDGKIRAEEAISRLISRPLKAE